MALMIPHQVRLARIEFRNGCQLFEQFLFPWSRLGRHQHLELHVEISPAAAATIQALSAQCSF